VRRLQEICLGVSTTRLEDPEYQNQLRWISRLLPIARGAGRNARSWGGDPDEEVKTYRWRAAVLDSSGIEPVCRSVGVHGRMAPASTVPHHCQIKLCISRAQPGREP